MKKLYILLIFLFFVAKFSSQTNNFIVYNYSALTLEGLLHANATNGSCYPRVLSDHPNSLNIIVQPGTPSTPEIVTYSKYANANDPGTNFPLTQWWVQTSGTATGGYRLVNNPTLAPAPPPGGVIANNTKYTGFYFVTKSGSTYYEEHFMGDPMYYSCTACLHTYHNGGTTEAEWFTIGDFAYVQVF